MPHAFPQVLSTRLTANQAIRVLRAANKSGLTPSAFARSLLAKVGAGATGGGDPEEALAAVCEALGLPEGTDPEVIGAAFTALLGAVNTAEPDDAASTDTTPPDPSAPGADPKTPPPGIPARLTQAGEIYLTPKQRQQIAAKGWTIPEFTALCKKIVRRA